MHSRPTSSAAQVSYGWTRSPGLIELVHARFTRQRFQPHAHDSWSLCAVISGVKNIALPSAPPLLARAGEVYLLRPGQAHAGCSVDAEPCEYAMLHVSSQEWQRQCTLRGLDAPLAAMAPARRPQLARQLADFVQATLAGQSGASDWSAVCDAFFAQHRLAQPSAPVPGLNRRIITARDYLHSNWSRAVPLDELARHSALSGFELTRRFSAAYGLPPHRYQLALRIMHAKTCLLQGAPIAEVASATGFSDQSHLGRVFKSMLGITPGMLARWLASQDGAA